MDGDTMVVGHPTEYHKGDLPSGEDVGAVTVFERESGEWAKQVTFYGPQPLGRFGSSIDLDGDTFVTNAPGQSTSGWSDGPYVQCAHSTAELYVYERTGGSWGRTQTIHPEDAVPRETCLGGDHHFVSLALDGDLLAIGDPWTESYVYLYERGPDAEWILTDTLSWEKDPDRRTHSFARAVDVSAEAERVVVGHPSSDGDPGVHVFDRLGKTWTRAATVAGCCAWAGTQIALGPSGDMLAAAGTAWFEGDPVRVWVRTDAGWNHVTDLEPQDVNNANPWISDLGFGEEGDTLAVGAWLDDASPSLVPEHRASIPIGIGSARTGHWAEKVISPFGDGAAYIFEATEAGDWEQTAKIQQADDVGNDAFGWDLDLGKHGLVVGAPGHTTAHERFDPRTDDPSFNREYDRARSCCHGAVYVYLSSEPSETVLGARPGGPPP